MARDRDASIIVELAARRGLDFVRHDPTDPYARLWLRICVEHVRRQQAHSALCALHDDARAGLLHTIAHVSATGPISPATRELAHRLTTQRIRLLLPWSGEDNATEARDRLREEWIRVYGDPNDPAVKARMDAVVAYLNGSATNA